MPNNNYYKLYCEICNWTLVTNEANDVEGLFVYNRSQIQIKIQQINNKTKKLTESKFMNQIKKFRCPRCGRPVSAKRITNPQDIIDQKKAQLEREEREIKLKEEFEK